MLWHQSLKSIHYRTLLISQNKKTTDLRVKTWGDISPPSPPRFTPLHAIQPILCNTCSATHALQHMQCNPSSATYALQPMQCNPSSATRSATHA